MTDTTPTSDSTSKRADMPAALRAANLAVLVLIVLLLGVRWLNQVNLFPPVPMDATIAPRIAASVDDIREVRFTTADGVNLYGWVLGRPDAPRKIVQFMGNAEFVGREADFYRKVGEALDATFLLFDYRGFANSEGRPSEAGLYADARAALKFAEDELGWPGESLILWGRSLGGGVASRLAAEMAARGAPPAALILEATFTSIPDMARQVLPILGKPEWLAYSGFYNINRAPALKLPVFVMHGNGDEIVPFSMGERLYEALPGPKEFLRLNGAHNNLWSNEGQARQIRVRLLAFLEGHGV